MTDFHTGFSVWGGGGGGDVVCGLTGMGEYFSQTRLRNRLSNENLIHLVRIAIEGPDLKEVNFNEILDIFKEKNRRIRL